MIASIRSALFLFLAILITAPAGLLITLSVVLPMRWRFRIIAAWRTLFMGLCAHILGLRYQVIGRENIPSTPSVVLSKHQSAWETVALQSIFPPLVFVLKRSLLMIPFLGWANWFALPLIVVGIILGALSSKDGGRNFCLVVLLIAAVRLTLGGGLI